MLMDSFDRTKLQGPFGMDQVSLGILDRARYQKLFGVNQMSVRTFWAGTNVLKDVVHYAIIRYLEV